MYRRFTQLVLGAAIIDPMSTRDKSSTEELALAAASLPTYTVQPGDTLYGIAQQFGTTVEELQQMNGIGDSTHIYAGKLLYIPDQTQPTPSSMN